MRRPRVTGLIKSLGFIGALCIAVVFGAVAVPINELFASATKSPIKRTTDLDMYFPGTEDLTANDMRVVSCGTWMPAQRKAQAATCWLVELGNGDKFLFDIGTGSTANLGSLNIPYDYLNKVFLSHLHSDHIGDMDALWIGGWTGGRQGALHVWGPSGSKPETGTTYAMDHLKKAYTWDYTGRLGVIPTDGGGLEVTEFDYTKINKVVYQENGVTIYSCPRSTALMALSAIAWSGTDSSSYSAATPSRTNGISSRQKVRTWPFTRAS